MEANGSSSAIWRRQADMGLDELHAEVRRLRRWGEEWRKRARFVEQQAKAARSATCGLAGVRYYDDVRAVLAREEEAQAQVRRLASAVNRTEAAFFDEATAGARACKGGEPFDPAETAAWKVGFERERVVLEARRRSREDLLRVAEAIGVKDAEGEKTADVLASVLFHVRSMRASMKGLVGILKDSVGQRSSAGATPDASNGQG